MKLSDTQMIILSKASQREGRALPLPSNLKGGAAQKVVNALISKGLLEEVDPGKGEAIWRDTGDGHGVTLVITSAGLAAIGVEAPTSAPKANKKPPKAAAAPKEKAPREGTKQAQMIDLLRRKDGATLAEIVEVTGWQKHTVRGAMAGALKKKLGLAITAEAEERGRVYRIA